MKLTKRDVDDVYRLDFGPGTAPIILSEEEMDELRAHLQAERDEQLGRWRDPENPNIVVYPHPGEDDGDGHCVLVLDELSGATRLDWEQIALPGPADRYFTAHPLPEPEPKTWLEAEHEEIWVITANLDATEITAGRRIWPEPRIGGAE